MPRILKDYPSIVLKTEDLNGKTDFAGVFGRTAPLHIEIGTGRAAFLLNQANAQPHVNFLGIERTAKYCRYAVDRIGRWSLSNVRIIQTNAASFLPDFVQDNSAEYLHIYFPDPWPKRRHHKRRFFCSPNLEQMLRCLKPNGIIKVATDHAGYFEQIQTVLAAYDHEFEEIDFLPAAGADQGEWTGTNFERKYLKEKRPIYTIAVRKIQSTTCESPR